jgi:hypothetical protein
MQHVRQTYKLRYAALQRTDIINQVYVHTIADHPISHMLGDRRHLEHSTYSHYSIILPPLIANTWCTTGDLCIAMAKPLSDRGTSNYSTIRSQSAHS